MSEEATPKAFLDRPAARWLAVLVILLCVGLLAYVHRGDLRRGAGVDPLPGADVATGDPAAPCIEQRFAEIDGMIEEGVVGEEQAAMFRQRAEAMCRATEGEGNGQLSPLPSE